MTSVAQAKVTRTHNPRMLSFLPSRTSRFRLLATHRERPRHFRLIAPVRKPPPMLDPVSASLLRATQLVFEELPALEAEDFRSPRFERGLQQLLDQRGRIFISLSCAQLGHAFDFTRGPLDRPLRRRQLLRLALGNLGRGEFRGRHAPSNAIHAPHIRFQLVILGIDMRPLDSRSAAAWVPSMDSTRIEAASTAVQLHESDPSLLERDLSALACLVDDETSPDHLDPTA